MQFIITEALGLPWDDDVLQYFDDAVIDTDVEADLTGRRTSNMRNVSAHNSCVNDQCLPVDAESQSMTQTIDDRMDKRKNKRKWFETDGDSDLDSREIVGKIDSDGGKMDIDGGKMDSDGGKMDSNGGKMDIDGSDSDSSSSSSSGVVTVATTSTSFDVTTKHDTKISSKADSNYHGNISSGNRSSTNNSSSSSDSSISISSRSKGTKSTEKSRKEGSKSTRRRKKNSPISYTASALQVQNSLIIKLIFYISIYRCGCILFKLSFHLLLYFI